mmetsp:Transcript_19274/g.37520  ORF Transcript_19274/g.37520 Transcript_19274/m.37520 type:complete len:223 (-) Transcript_19274:1531-2199(-)
MGRSGDGALVVLVIAIPNPTNLPGRREHHLKMIPLRKIRNVDYVLGLQLLQPILNRRHIRRIVPIPPIALLQHQGHLVLIHEDALGPPIFHADQSLRLELLNDRWNFVVVKGLSALFHGDIQTVVDLFEFLPGDIAENLPDATAFRISGLEFDHVELTDLFEFRILVESLFGVFVELGEVGDVGHAFVAVLKIGIFLLEILNQHSELRSPVPDVIDPQYHPI